MTRIVLTAKDLVILTGCSDRSAQRTLKEMRDALGKPDHAVITIQEYCNYNMIDRAEVIAALTAKKSAA